MSLCKPQKGRKFPYRNIIRLPNALAGLQALCSRFESERAGRFTCPDLRSGKYRVVPRAGPCGALDDVQSSAIDVRDYPAPPVLTFS